MMGSNQGTWTEGPRPEESARKLRGEVATPRPHAIHQPNEIPDRWGRPSSSSAAPGPQPQSPRSEKRLTWKVEGEGGARFSSCRLRSGPPPTPALSPLAERLGSRGSQLALL
jgi:hypothetical protein